MMEQENPEPDPGHAAAGNVAAASPMIAQYLEIRAANPDCLLFYRMGDFYELFFEDAEVASRALGIALTARGRHQGQDIPMCGVPVHSSGDYLQKLIRLGHRVAVCEQLEDPAEARKRGSKSVVRRDVTRLVTPGTLTEDSLLAPDRHNYLIALARVRSEDRLAVAWVDISTGDFAVASLAPDALAAELARLDGGEIIVPEPMLADPQVGPVLKDQRVPVMPLPPARFDSGTGERRLREQFDVLALDAFGGLTRAEIAACGALIDYVSITQRGRLPALRPPRRRAEAGIMLIDAATRANLELVRSSSGERRGSLLDIIDCTVTGSGGRLLAERLSGPLTDPAVIEDRLDAVAFFTDEAQGGRDRRDDLRAKLKGAPDLGRALTRITLGRGSPRDVAAIRDGLKAARAISHSLSAPPLTPAPSSVQAALAVLARDDGGLVAALADALGADLPLQARDGGFIRSGFHAELDENRRLRDESRQVIASLQTRYAEDTQVKSLKLRHNNVLGFFVEVTAQHGPRLMQPPHDRAFIHRQTLANAMRFTTSELASLEQRISLAADRALAIEMEVFEGLCRQVTEASALVLDAAAALAELDLSAALAELAMRRRYVRPKVDRSLNFRIEGGRHPVVEAALERSGDTAFVPNDCRLDAEPQDKSARRIWLLTGPNMAGKSTFLRQNALIAILAQAGSFVPAREARIGIVDRVFSRVGAADDLARGRSTFMVEMVETAVILNQATARSLVILDEIGRGTATFDGLSIAWATVEHLHEVNRCRALFATHFHELTALNSRLPHLANATMKVREFQGDVVFLHEVAPGAADRSYGIQVAKLAGLPASVIERAGEVLTALERSEEATARRELIDDLPLFAAARPRAPARAGGDKASDVEAMLAEINPDDLTPREALEKLYALRGRLGKG